MTRHNQPKLFLASRSPRRRQLLAQAGWQFEIINADIDEAVREDEKPKEYVKRMAKEKVWAAMQNLLSQQLAVPLCIIGADTIVVDGNTILGKPRDDAEAVIMLTRLRARIHHVYSAIAVLMMKKPNQQFSKSEIIEEICLSEVVMRDYSDEEIIQYVASGDARDKAGAYAIQNADFHPVSSIKGCYANIIGLPMCCLAPILLQHNIKPQHPNEDFNNCCLNQRLEDHQRAQCCQTIWNFDERNEAN